jgi:putative Mg2+ transporter-C (MgtC) family protein
MIEIWSRVGATLRSEFADLGDVEQLTRVVLRLTFALLLGAMIGWDRERRDSAAGLRTHMLVALGAAVFVLVPQLGGADWDAMSRVVQGVIAGIGFLGAGAVLKLDDEQRIQGLTTAAGIWATAAIGVTVGLGREGTALIITLATLFVLVVLLPLKERARDDADAGR